MSYGIEMNDTWDMKAARERLDACIKRQKARKFPYARKAWYGYRKDSHER